MTAAPSLDQLAVRAPRERTRYRVLHLLPDLAIGGGQTIVLNHLLHADRGLYDIVVATLHEGGELTSAFVEANLADPIDLGHREGRNLPTVRRIASLLRDERIDLLHVHSDVDRKLGQAAALLTGVPVVGHLHAEWIHLGAMPPARETWPHRARARLAGAARDAIERRTVARYIAESSRVQELFEPLLDQPIAVLRQAIPIERFEAAQSRRSTRASLGIDDHAPVAICVSRLVEGKGQAAVLDAFAAVRRDHPAALLLLVGEGDERQALEARARTVGVEGATRFLGSRHDVPDLLAASDAFVFASDNEGFGLAVLEAMASSLPVVAFRLPALEEFVVPGETGFLVDHGDIAGLAALTSALLADPAARQRLGAAGRRLVLERFPRDAVARSFEATYEAALAARRSRSSRRTA